MVQALAVEWSRVVRTRNPGLVVQDVRPPPEPGKPSASDTTGPEASGTHFFQGLPFPELKRNPIKFPFLEDRSLQVYQGPRFKFHVSLGEST